MRQRYHGDCTNIDDFCEGGWEYEEPDIDDAEVLYAFSDNDGYEGSNYVLYRRNGKLYENNSSHCSCNGFTWEPDEVTVQELRYRFDKGEFWSWRNNKDAIIELLAELEGNAPTQAGNV